MLRLLSTAASPPTSTVLRSSVTAAAVQSTRRAVHAQALVVRPTPAARRVIAAQAPTSSRGLHFASTASRVSRSTPVGPSLFPQRAVGPSSASLSLRQSSAHLSTLTLRPRKPARVSPPLLSLSEVKRSCWIGLRWGLAMLVAFVLWLRHEQAELAAATLQHWDVEAMIARGGAPVALPPPIRISESDREAIDRVLPWHLRFLAGRDTSVKAALVELINRISGMPPAATLDELEDGLKSTETVKMKWWLPPWLLHSLGEIDNRVEAAELLIDTPANWPVSDAVRLQAGREVLEQAISQTLRLLAYHQQRDVWPLQPSRHSTWKMWAVLTDCYARLGQREELDQACRCMQLAVEREIKKHGSDAAFSKQLKLAVEEFTSERQARLSAMEGDWHVCERHSWTSASAGMGRLLTEIERRLQSQTERSRHDPLSLSLRLALTPSWSQRRHVLLLSCFAKMHDAHSRRRPAALRSGPDDPSGTPKLHLAAWLDVIDDATGLGQYIYKLWRPDAPLPTPQLSFAGEPPTMQLDLSFEPESASSRLKKVSRLADYATLFA